MTVWNQAAFKQRTPPRKYKPVPPVGTSVQLAGAPVALLNRVNTDRTCSACGHFVCSCSSKFHVSLHTSDPGGPHPTVPSGAYARVKPHMATMRAEAEMVLEASMKGLPRNHWTHSVERQAMIDVIAEKLFQSWPRTPSWGPEELESKLRARGSMPGQRPTSGRLLGASPIPTATPCMQCGRKHTVLSGRVCSDERSCYEAYCARQGSQAMK